MSVIRMWPLIGLSAVAGAIGSATTTQDPCSLLSAAEAKAYVGTLASPPYRASGDPATPNVAGGVCVYRGVDGRVLTVEPDWTGGKDMARAQNTVTSSASSISKSTGLTAGTKVAQQDSIGPWDQATWYPNGALFVVKGSASIIIDVSGASGQKGDAYAIARTTVARIAHPLAYDGAKAVALAPKPVKHPANACDFVSRATVEGAIGPLSGAPVPDSDGNKCTYHVATAQGSRTYSVEFTWEGGQKNYNMLAHGPQMMSGMLGTPASTPMDTMKPTGQMGAMMSGMMKMVTGAPKSQAAGAPSTVGFQTDTTLKGPWDRAALMHGTQLIAVRHDVFVGMDLQSADYEKAKALMAAICSRL
jgi:hypothetical protein